MSATEESDDVATQIDASFDRYARMVRRTLGVPVALVSIVEATRQVFPGAEGLGEPWQSTRETPLSHSFCQYVVADRRPMIVSDARLDARLRDNRAIDELGAIAYAGWPLTDHSGTVIGSLCAIDTLPRRWTDYDIQGLSDLAAACSAELGARELAQVNRRHYEQAEHLHQRSRVWLGLSESLAETDTLADVALAVERVGLSRLGCSNAGLWLRPSSRAIRNDPRGHHVGTLGFVAHARVPWRQAGGYLDVDCTGDNPVGAAFRARRPEFFCTRVAQDEVYADQHLSTDSGECRAFVPLVQGERTLGVLVLVWHDAQDFDEEVRTTIGAMAGYTAQAVSSAMLLEERAQVASTLQEAMLTAVPQTNRLRLAARYRPAGAREQVGGDWYDALELPSGHTALVIGDVVGHDIVAAALMGQLRSTLRTLMWAVAEPPSTTVSRLDRAIPELGIEALASLLLVQVEAGSDPDGHGALLRWSNAGHPPPLLVDPDGSSRWLAGSPELLLGIDPAARRTDQTAGWHRGAILVMFTDGLVERRGRSIDDGLQGLQDAVLQHRHLDLEALLDAVLGDLLPRRLDDDVAVLAARCDAPS